MKFKGQILHIKNKDYVLKEKFTEGGFSVIYSTNNPNIICKVQVLSVPSIAQAYKNQKQILTHFNHPNIVKLYDSTEIVQNNKESFGFLLLQNCSKGTAFNLLEENPGNLEEKSVLKVFLSVASVLQCLHNEGITHRDIKLENVLRNEKGQFKICDFGSSTRQVITSITNKNRSQIEEFIEKTTTPIYRSPQQLDLYSGFQIGSKVDVFAMGCLTFMLCFKKQPFESRLSAINKQYFIPEHNPYSKQLIELIEDCFITNPQNRPSAKQVKERIQVLQKMKKAQLDINYEREVQITEDEMSRINSKNITMSAPADSTTFLDKIKLIYSQFTTETEGWVAGFTQDNNQAPPLKYNRFIISKCWQKRYKVQKVNQIIWQYSQNNQSKCIPTLKILILMHNFLRKGPTQVVEYDKQFSPLKLATKLYKHWKSNQKPTNCQDFQRNIFLCLLIRFYALIIIGKARFNYQNSDFFQGNYSLVPFFTKKKQKKDVTLLKLSLIESMLQFLEICSTFHQIVQNKSYLVDIQRSIILSIVDEEYCLVSTFVFIYSAFKHAISFVDEQLNMEKIIQKIEEIDNKFQAVYLKLAKLFEVAMKFSSLFQNQNFLLNTSVIKYIRDIKVSNVKKGKFQISNYLNYKNQIFGLKIPLTYEQVIKNPNFLKDLTNSQDNNNTYIDINQYKLKKQQQKEKKFNKINSNEQNINKNANIPQQRSIKTVKQSNQNVKQNKADNPNTMQFTHQNLNKDFMTVDNQNNIKSDTKSDRFKDFLSIVDTKFDKFEEKKIQKTNDQKKQKEEDLRNASMQVFNSLTHQSIHKMQLINFFDDDEEEDKKQLRVSPNKKGQQGQSKFNKTQLLNPNSSQTQIEKGVKSQILQNNQSSSFIDLKMFVIEEVKKNAEQYLIEYKSLKFFQKVGNGHSSEVYRGEWRGREVAIKRIKDDMSSPSSQKQFKREIMTSVKIRNHPQLVTLIGVAEFNKEYFIINEFCYGLTLFDLLHESRCGLPWKIRISIMKQIARGIVFLHTNEPPIIHRDLKSLNVLLSNKYDEKSQEIQIKIADFGLSRDFASTYMTGTLGTYHWMAPQIFNNEPYSLKADVYSYGIVLWEIASRSPPYKNMLNPQSLMKFITIQNGRPDLTIVDSKCPLQVRMLMMRCWDRFPANRPNFNEILTVLNNITIVNQ